MDNAEREPEEDEHEKIIRWYAVTHSQEWATTVQALADTAFAQCAVTALSRTAKEEDREAARAEAAVWAIVRNWKEIYEGAFHEMKESQSETPEDESMVGAKAEDQWYEKR